MNLTKLASLLGAVAALASGDLFAVTVNYTTLDYPSAVSTTIQGISGSTLVGDYFTAASPQSSTGFIYNGSTFTSLAYPGAAQTYASGVSGNTVVGIYRDASGDTSGFTYDIPSHAYQTLNDPLGAEGTYLNGISGGVICGEYQDATGEYHGMLYSNGSFTTQPNDPLGLDGESIFGISGNSYVGQYYPENATTIAFVYNGSTFVTPSGPHGEPLNTDGISGSNIVGSYYPSTATYSQGFFYNSSMFLSLSDPNAIYGTFANGVDGNTVVGFYTDGIGEHGFIAQVPEPSSIALLGLGSAGLFTVSRIRRRAHRSNHVGQIASTILGRCA